MKLFKNLNYFVVTQNVTRTKMYNKTTSATQYNFCQFLTIQFVSFFSSCFVITLFPFDTHKHMFKMLNNKPFKVFFLQIIYS